METYIFFNFTSWAWNTDTYERHLFKLSLNRTSVDITRKKLSDPLYTSYSQIMEVLNFWRLLVLNIFKYIYKFFKIMNSNLFTWSEKNVIDTLLLYLFNKLNDYFHHFCKQFSFALWWCAILIILYLIYIDIKKQQKWAKQRLADVCTFRFSCSFYVILRFSLIKYHSLSVH